MYGVDVRLGAAERRIALALAFLLRAASTWAGLNLESRLLDSVQHPHQNLVP
jgi:hypothetical protein